MCYSSLTEEGQYFTPLPVISSCVRLLDITYDDKNGNVNAIFTNITEEGMVYVAEYNENGTLLSIKSDEISDSVIIPFTCVNKSKVKVFIWKNDMKPLFNKVFTLN